MDSLQGSRGFRFGLLDGVEHADVSSCLLRRDDRRCRRQNRKPKEHERPHEHCAVGAITWEDHDHVLAIQFLLGRLQHGNESLTGAFRQHARRQGDVERPAAEHGVPRLTSSAESKPQRRRSAPGVPRGIRTTTEALHPETWS